MCELLDYSLTICSWHLHAKSLQSCLTLCHPMDCSPLGSSLHGISRQEYWSGWPGPTPGGLPDPGIKPASPALRADSLPLSHWRSPDTISQMRNGGSLSLNSLLCKNHSPLDRSPGEGNGNPLQYSCLENSMDTGAWWATVHRVTKSWTRLKRLSTHACNKCVQQGCPI